MLEKAVHIIWKHGIEELKLLVEHRRYVSAIAHVTNGLESLLVEMFSS